MPDADTTIDLDSPTLASELYEANLRISKIIHLAGALSTDAPDDEFLDDILELDDHLNDAVVEALGWDEGRTPRGLWGKYLEAAEEQAAEDIDDDTDEAEQRRIRRGSVRDAREMFVSEVVGQRMAVNAFVIQADVPAYKMRGGMKSYTWGVYTSKWFAGRTYNEALAKAFEWAQHEYDHPEP